MGRTVPTYRNALESEILSWRNFRRALRNEEKATFDNLMNTARNHATASMNVARFEVIEAVYMSILLEHQKEIESLKKRIEDNENKRYNI